MHLISREHKTLGQQKTYSNQLPKNIKPSQRKMSKSGSLSTTEDVVKSFNLKQLPSTPTPRPPPRGGAGPKDRQRSGAHHSLWATFTAARGRILALFSCHLPHKGRGRVAGHSPASQLTSFSPTQAGLELSRVIYCAPATIGVGRILTLRYTV